MSDEGSTNRNGKYKQRYQQPIDNPEIPENKDWWNELCRAHGEENHWDKEKKED
tara:strand:+ start:124 stop:285 length:162 start_codon:yes stop_codon:yes gene_type:complete